MVVYMPFCLFPLYPMFQNLHLKFWQFLKKLNTDLLYIYIKPSNSTPMYIPQGIENLCPQNLYLNIYSNIVLNSQKVETDLISVNW